MARATDWAASRARLTPGKLALVEVATGLRLTYAELHARVNRLAGYFRQIGVKKGDRVALLAVNAASYLEILFAVGKIGAIFVPLNYRFAIAELEYVLRDCRPHVLIYQDAFADRVQKLLQKTDLPYAVDQARYEAVVADGDAVQVSTELDEEEPWVILYTGGTTGRPKGVILSHRAILWNSINTVVSWGLTEQDVTPVYMPMFHTGGLNALTMPVLHVGGTVVIGHEFKPSRILRVLEEEKCTIALFVPTMYHMLVEAPEFAKTPFTHMHTFYSGGASCPHTIYEKFFAKGCQFKEGYGMTEAGPNNFYIHPNDAKQKIGSVGMAMFHNQVRIVDESGRVVPDGETGELCLSGPHLFSGYWNLPEATAEAFVDGWLKTGDLARRDADGYHYIVGRKKEMIVTGGENVYPLEVENVLSKHAEVSEVAVVGLPDAKWGEAVTAVIVPVHGTGLSAEELKKFCVSQLANYKIPKQFQFVSELPKTAVGKIDKKAILQIYTQAQIG